MESSPNPRRPRRRPQTVQKSSSGDALRDSVGAGLKPAPTTGIPKQRALLLPYQRRWVEDNSPLKIVVKARQIGYSFAATLRAVLRCLARKTTWIFLSKGERQSRLLMEKVGEHIRSFGVVTRAFESEFFEGTSLRVLETRFPNGSVIYGLPANPETARGYSGHVTLDEFAFHADAEKIYAALFPSITRGYGLEIISTPNGQAGKFYELARQAGLANSESRIQNSELKTRWSGHLVDIYDAVRQGLRINIELLRAGCEDESAWQQEFCCQFVSTAENFIPPELLAACLSAEASTDFPLAGPASRPAGSSTPTPTTTSARGPASGFGASEKKDLGSRIQDLGTSNPEFFLGIDIGRQHDRTVFWLDEVGAAMSPSPTGGQRPPLQGSRLGSDVLHSEFIIHNSQFPSAPHLTPDTFRWSVTRLVRTLARAPFAEQIELARALLLLEGSDARPLVRRAALDATGMGAPLAESLEREFHQRVEPVVFTAAVKEDLAFRTKRRIENRLSLLPDTREVRRAFSAVKKFVTPSGNLRFDAARTDAGHADEFWAKALADYAADPSADARRASRPSSDGFLADGAPLISPAAFVETGGRWAELEHL